MSTARSLSENEKRFARARASGRTLKESYEDAGYSLGVSEKKRPVRGCEIQARPRVMAEIKRLQKLAEKKAVLSLEQRGALLTEIAVDKESETTDNRIRAVDVLNKMTGAYNGMNVGVVVSIEDKRAAVLAAMQEADL